MHGFKYFVIYQIFLRMDIRPALTHLPFHHVGEVDGPQIVVADGNRCCDFRTGKFIGLQTDNVQTSRGKRCNDNAVTSATLSSVLASFCAVILQVRFEVVRHDYHKYRDVPVKPHEAGHDSMLKRFIWTRFLNKTGDWGRLGMLFR